MKAIVLFAHGARDPRWAEPFEAIAARVRERAPGVDVRLAFLELMAPSLEVAGAALAEAGATEVAIVPLFLGAGGHVRRDLPALVAALEAAHPSVRWTLGAPVGERPEVIEAIADAAAAYHPPPR